MRTPVIDYLNVLRNFQPDFRYLPRAFLYLIKFLFFEPFRWLERLLFRRAVRTHRVHESPIFILGYYRSGTTHLQELMLQDPRFGYLNFFQCLFPSAFNLTERLFKAGFGAFSSLIRFRHPAHNIPFHFAMPGEEDVALVSSGYRNASNWGQLFPRHFKHFFNKTVFFEGGESDIKNDFSYELKDLITRVSLANSGKQLLLKSPPQTARIALLKELYPNAKFIFIRRNLYQVYKSNQKLWRSFHGQCLQAFDEETANEEILWSLKKTMEVYSRDKRQVDENSLIEVTYEDLQESPIAVLEKIYGRLGLNGFANVRNRFERYVERCHGANIDVYRYSEEDVTNVERSWREWLDLWSYERPSVVSRGNAELMVRRQ